MKKQIVFVVASVLAYQCSSSPNRPGNQDGRIDSVMLDGAIVNDMSSEIGFDSGISDINEDGAVTPKDGAFDSALDTVLDSANDAALDGKPDTATDTATDGITNDVCSSGLFTDSGSCVPTKLGRVIPVLFAPRDAIVEKGDYDAIAQALKAARDSFHAQNSAKGGLTFGYRQPITFIQSKSLSTAYCPVGAGTSCETGLLQKIYAEILSSITLDANDLVLIFARGMKPLVQTVVDHRALMTDWSGNLTSRVYDTLKTVFAATTLYTRTGTPTFASPWFNEPHAETFTQVSPSGSSSLSITNARTALSAGVHYLIPSSNSSFATVKGSFAISTVDSTSLFPKAAIEIDGAQQLILDCQGAQIRPPSSNPLPSSASWLTNQAEDTQSQGVGIRVRDSKHVVVKNCTVTGYRYGVLVEDSENVLIENVTTSHNYRTFSADFFMEYAPVDNVHFGGGIRVMRSKFVTLHKNKGVMQMSGIEFWNTTQSLVVDNFFNHSQVPFFARQSSNNHVVFNNFDWGIRFETRLSGTGNQQVLLRGSAPYFMKENLLKIDDLGITDEGFPIHRLSRQLDRDTASPYWDLAVSTLDSSGVLIEDASHQNLIAGNSLLYGGDGLFIRANGTACSNDNLIVNNIAAYSPNNGLELSFCSNDFIGNKVIANDHGMWLGAGAHDVILDGNQFLYNYSYGLLGTRNKNFTVSNNTFAFMPVAIAMKDEHWGGSLNLAADPSGVNSPTENWQVTNNTFKEIKSLATISLISTSGVAVYRLSGTKNFNASQNSYQTVIYKCLLPNPWSSAANTNLTHDCTVK